MKHIKLYEEWKNPFKRKVKEEPIIRRSYEPLPEPEFSDGIRNWGDDTNDTDDGWVYTILTQDIEDKWEGREGSLNDMGLHILCDTEEELENKKNLYPLGGEYNGSKIIDTYISRESDGMGTS